MLKQLLISKRKKQAQDDLEAVRSKLTDVEKRSTELESAIEEAKTEEEMTLVTEEIEKIESEQKELEKEEADLIGAIEAYDEELNGLEESVERAKNEKPEQRKETQPMKNKRQRTMPVQESYHEREDVKQFYTELRTRLHARAAGQVLPEGEAGAELVIPEIIVNAIRDRIGDYMTLYDHIDVIKAGGKVKLILDVDTSEATWLEQRGTLPESDDSALTAVEFDGFKVGRIVYIDNSLLDDSVINLNDYLTKRIARSIAKALNKAILKGEGATLKQPDGVIPKIPAENKVTKKPTYEELIPILGLIDTGEDATGEIIMVVHRQTYYAHLAVLTLHVNSDGKDVIQLPNLAEPNFLGLKVEFNNYMDTDKIVFGVFENYKLIERETARIDMSTHYKFREDQTAVRGIGRYDGKPTKPEAFVEVTLDLTPEV